MTMAQATTISFLSPLLITVLSIPLLHEIVGRRRWAAVLAGMIGMLIVVRPGTAGFQPAALYGVASSSCWALALIITRGIAASDAPQTTIFWSSLVGAVMLTILLPFDAAWPTAWQLSLCLMLGVMSSAGQWLVVLAHRLAPRRCWRRSATPNCPGSRSAATSCSAICRIDGHWSVRRSSSPAVFTPRTGRGSEPAPRDRPVDSVTRRHLPR